MFFFLNLEKSFGKGHKKEIIYSVLFRPDHSVVIVVRMWNIIKLSSGSIHLYLFSPLKLFFFKITTVTF